MRDKGYRYRDIAVIVGDIGSYKSGILSSFLIHEIPYFIDDKRSIHTNSLVAVITQALDALTLGWRYKSMMSFLRLYMLDITQDEIDLIDNYLLEQGIQGETQWKTPWERESEGISLEAINQTREKVVAVLGGLKEAFESYKQDKKKLTIKEATIAIYGFLEEIKAYETIEDRIAYYQEQGEGALEQENTQIWGQVMEVLERLVAILGEETTSLKAYNSLLKISFSYIKMPIIPPSRDQVLIGAADRTRLPEVKALFVLGVNEGVLPKLDDSMNLFSEMDKLTLATQANSKEGERLINVLVNQPLYGHQFMVYSLLTRAKEQLDRKSVV